MTDFGPLLPPRTAPPRLPARGGPAAVLDAARSRRRKQATKVVGTGGALSVVFLGMAVLRGPAPLHTIEEGPATKPPAVTTPGSLSPGPASTPRASSPATVPGGEGSPAPTAGPGSGASAPTTSPSILLPTGPPVLPTGGPPPPTVRYVTVLRDVVEDQPAEDCKLHTAPANPDDVLCTRQFGPVQVPSGTPVDFGYEVCAMTNDVTLHTTRQEEYAYWFTTDAAPEEAPVWTAHERPTGVGAHDYTVPAGQCVRWTFRWDGRGDDGQPLAVGSYYVVADIPGNWAEQGAIDTTVRFNVT